MIINAIYVEKDIFALAIIHIVLLALMGLIQTKDGANAKNAKMELLQLITLISVDINVINVEQVLMQKKEMINVLLVLMGLIHKKVGENVKNAPLEVILIIRKLVV